MSFRTAGGTIVPAVTRAQMAAIDAYATDEEGYRLTQMMEHAGRALATKVMVAGPSRADVVVGGGGNGGGGLVCARWLDHWDVSVRILTTGDPETYHPITAQQLQLCRNRGVSVVPVSGADRPSGGTLGVDAVVGYGIAGRLRASAVEALAHLKACDMMIALDLPTGVDADTGATDPAMVMPDLTVTLALPKHGLERVPTPIWLADIGISRRTYEAVGIEVPPQFGPDQLLRLHRDG
jgi:NAD(P)H-hydrate epimerase